MCNLTEYGPSFCSVARVTVGLDCVVGAKCGVNLSNGTIGRCAPTEEIDRATYGLWTVPNRCGTLDDFHTRHADGHGEVVRRGRSIGCGGNEHPIFHECDLGTAIRIASAQTDVGPEAKAIFSAKVHTGYGGEDLVDVGVFVPLQFLLIDHVSGSCDPGSSSLCRDDHRAI